MKKTLFNILKAFGSNIASLISGILVGFVVPKMMGIEDYANYKIYTLYVIYLALFSLGLGDGLYLKFSGIDKDQLNQDAISYYLHRYYLQLFVFFVPAFLFSLFFADGEYKFIFCSLCLTLITSQITSVHQNLSVLTSRFNEYSFRVIIKSILTILFVLILFLIYKFFNYTIGFRIYIVGVVLIEFLLAIWYIFSYKSFNFHKSNFKPCKDDRYISLLLLGFPLLVSNMAGSIFLNLDRQFVSLLFSKNDYAVYAFTYNMLTLITTMTSAISLVLFPSLKQKKDLDVKSTMDYYGELFALFIAASLMVYFPLYIFVPYFLPKYALSLEIFRVILPGIMLSSFVSVVFINFYKYDKKVINYFIRTLISIVVSAFLNYFAYLIFKDYIFISCASIIALIFWYVLTESYFIKKYKTTWKKRSAFLLLVMVSFYLITYFVNNVYIGFLSYVLVYVSLVLLFYRETLKRFFAQLRNRTKKS